MPFNGSDADVLTHGHRATGVSKGKRPVAGSVIEIGASGCRECNHGLGAAEAVESAQCLFVASIEVGFGKRRAGVAGASSSAVFSAWATRNRYIPRTGA